ncbi:MAG: hypothetical protein ACLP29_05770 [Dissulfurispiraceae bacterium]|jgi:hypothetical protein
MKEAIANILLSAAKLPGYRIHPYETYARLKIFGVNNINHPKDLFDADVKMLTKAARAFAETHCRKLAAIGFGTGLPGGPAGVAAGVTIELEEYLRRVFLLSQEIGHVYGIIPMPFVDTVNENTSEYYADVQAEILKAILIGMGIGGITMTVSEIAKLVAAKEAKEIAVKKISNKIITELAKQIAKKLGVRLTQGQMSRRALRIIPVLGGGVNAVFCYTGMKVIGNRMIDTFEKEHKSVRRTVRKYWKDK